MLPGQKFREKATKTTIRKKKKQKTKHKTVPIPLQEHSGRVQASRKLLP
jgi:hypothetical protein